MNKLVFSIALMVAGGISTTAQAQTFNGPYIGVQGGLNHDKVGTLGTQIGAIAIDRSKDSFTGGVYAGYDVPIAPRVVIGVEAGFNLAASDSVTRMGGNDLAQINPSYAFDFSARAGYLVADRTLLYVRGGYDNVRAKVTRGTPGATIQDKESFDGWLVGGGIERSLTDSVTARIEYRYSDLSGGDGKFDRHQALVGVAYRF
jgi:outer membrane immunogenic protein